MRFCYGRKEVSLQLLGCACRSVFGSLHVGQIANQVIITDFGIEKSHDIAIDEKACSIVVENVREELSS
jgi:uncharacterized metal-binding protein